MKLKTTPIHTVKCEILFEPEDRFPIFDRLTYSFDCDAWSLTISDSNTYFRHQWKPEQKRSFPELMLSLDEFYLLGKIADRTAFDLKETKQELIQTIRTDFDITDKERSNRLRAVKNMQVSHTDGLTAWLQTNSMAYDPYQLAQYDYPLKAKCIAHFFVTQIQPELQAYIAAKRTNFAHK